MTMFSDEIKRKVFQALNCFCKWTLYGQLYVKIPNIWRKLKNKVTRKWWIYNKGESMLKRFGFNVPSPGL